MAERVVTKDPIGIETAIGVKSPWRYDHLPADQLRAIFADENLSALVGLLPFDGSRPSEENEQAFIDGQAELCERYGLTAEEMYAILNELTFVERTPRSE